MVQAPKTQLAPCRKDLLPPSTTHVRYVNSQQVGASVFARVQQLQVHAGVQGPPYTWGEVVIASDQHQHTAGGAAGDALLLDEGIYVLRREGGCRRESGWGIRDM